VAAVPKPFLQVRERIAGTKRLGLATSARSREVAVWAGAKVRNIVGPGEVSAAGTPGETGVILLYVPKTSDAAKAGLFAGEILLAFNGKPVK